MSSPQPTGRRLETRTYTVTWHWRDQDPRPFKVDEVRATTVPGAISKVVRALSTEYADVRSNLAVIDVSRCE